MKTQFNVRLSEAHKKMIESLVKFYHSDKTKVVEKAVSELHEREISKN